VYNGERAWKDIADRLQVTHYLSRDDHYWKIRARKQRTDVGKFSFVNRTTADWNQLLKELFVFPLAKAHTFSKRARKVVDREGGGGASKGKLSEDKCIGSAGRPKW
jgi:hypothetical protein